MTKGLWPSKPLDPLKTHCNAFFVKACIALKVEKGLEGRALGKTRTGTSGIDSGQSKVIAIPTVSSKPCRHE